MSGQLAVHRKDVRHRGRAGEGLGESYGSAWIFIVRQRSSQRQAGARLCNCGSRLCAAIGYVRIAIGALRPLPHFKSVAVFAGVLRSHHYLPGKLGVRTLREAGNEIASCDLRPLRVVQQIGKETDLVEKAILVLRVLLLR